MRALSNLLLLGFAAAAAGIEIAKPPPQPRKLRKNTRSLQGNGVIQVDEYDCSAKADAYASTVLMDFHTDVSNLDDAAIDQMEAAFVEAYASAIFALCDVPFFRTVTDAQVEVLSNVDESHYRELPFDLFKKTNRTHFLKVDIQAECRECNEDVIFSGIGEAGKYEDNLELVLPTSASRRAAPTSQDDGEGACICPSRLSYIPAMRAPTEFEFKAVFDFAIANVNNVALPEKYSLFEAEEVECESTASDFHSSVFVRFDGDLSALEEADIVLLEDAFMATYNGLNFAYCDIPYFRTIQNVTLDRSTLRDPEDSGRRRRLSEETDGIVLDFNQNVLLVDPPFDANVLKFDISAECRGCEDGTPLFSLTVQPDHDDSSKDNKSKNKSKKSQSEDGSAHMEMVSNLTVADIIPTLPPHDLILGRSNTLQGDSGYCYCPAHPEGVGRAPTALEFQAAFGLTLTALKEKGSLDSVATLEDVLEVSHVACEMDATDFTASVFVELDMPVESLTEFQKALLADSFLQSYNALTFGTCDQYFREATEVTLVSTRDECGSSGRRLEGHIDDGPDPNTTRQETEAPSGSPTETPDDRFPFVFNVLGKCRDCPVDDSGSLMLFDESPDESTRRILLSQDKISSSIVFGSSVAPAFAGPSRWLMDNDGTEHTCSCPSDSHPDGSAGPTDQAFIDIFNCRIADLEAAGLPTGFGKVADVVEATDLCHGHTFYSFMARYKLGFSGDIAAVPDEVLGETFRTAYNDLRPGDCDTLVASSNAIQRDVAIPNATTTTSDVRFMIDTLQLEEGEIFDGLMQLAAFIAAYNACLQSQGYTAVLVTVILDPSEAPSAAPTGTPTYEPTHEPTEDPTKDPSKSPSREPSRSPSRSPSREPSRSPSDEPSLPPSIPPSMEPSVSPTNDRAMCNGKVTELTDSVVIDYRVSRVADIELPFGIKVEATWPLQEPATLIVAEEYLAAYNRLQRSTFCDPFTRRIASVNCVSVKNKVTQGTVCCEVHFKCRGNCEKFIYPNRDPIGAYYDQPGFEYPTDESCEHKCDIENGPDRAPSFSEHMDKINDSVPLEMLAFEFRGFASGGCPH